MFQFSAASTSAVSFSSGLFIRFRKPCHRRGDISYDYSDYIIKRANQISIITEITGDCIATCSVETSDK